jgi:hypothetical protein
MVICRVWAMVTTITRPKIRRPDDKYNRESRFPQAPRAPVPKRRGHSY